MLDRDNDVPLVVLTQLVLCESRGKYCTTWKRVHAKWLRSKKPVYQSPWWEGWSEMKRYMAEVTKGDKKWKPPVEPFLKDLPEVAKLLTDPWWDDGSPREVCYITVRVGLDGTQTSINDPSNEASITTNAEGLMECLQLVEEALKAGRSLWRKWGGKKNKK
jgi:hypothetical protein